MNNFVILPTYTKEGLKKDIFKSKITIDDFNTVLKIFLIKKKFDSVDSILFTRDYRYLIHNSIKSNYNVFYNYLQYSIYGTIFDTELTFNKCLTLLIYFLNYFDYTIIKFQKHIKSLGSRNCYRIVSIDKIKNEVSDIYNLNSNLVIKKDKHINFNTNRNYKIRMEFL